MTARAAQLSPLIESDAGSVNFTLLRNCSCGEHSRAEGQCDACKDPDNVASSLLRTASGIAFRSESRGADFSRIPILSPGLGCPVVQPKLRIGQANDPLEREADRAADQVMRMPTPALLQLSSNRTREEDEVHRKEITPHVGGEVVPALVHDVLRQPGHPLDSSARVFFEPRFGRDLSHVRISIDARAAQSAASVGARAYTAGRHIVFGAGQYTPGTTNRRRLIAHELTHVVQQSDVAGPVYRYWLGSRLRLTLVEQLFLLQSQTSPGTATSISSSNVTMT